MISISIIMPLYNAEKYLDEALRCIQKQTYKEYELICIDDASTDTTTDILRRFQSEDNRIRIFSNKERFHAQTESLCFVLAMHFKARDYDMDFVAK